MNRLTFIGLFLVLLSCNSRNPLAIESREVDFKDKTGDVIEAHELNLDVPGVQDIVVYDSLLFFITRNPTGMLQVYNINTLQHIASFCQRGRAKNEFTGQVFLINEQYYFKDGDLIFPLLDNKSLIQKEVNVSASLREGHTVVGDVELRSSDDRCFVLLENGLEKIFSYRNPYIDAEMGEMTLPQYAVREHDKIVREIKVFKKHVKSENPENLELWYSGSLLKRTNNNLVIMPMSGMDYILFFDLDKKKNWALHQIGTPLASEICVYDDDSKNYFGGFGRPIADNSSDIFLVSYFGGEHTEKAMKEGKMRGELLLFDWDGNYIGGVKLDTNYHSSSYDSKGKKLYAVNIASEKIFTFDLSEFMKNIGK